MIWMCIYLSGVFRTLKHHVFEKVRKPTASLRFQPEADVVIHAHGHQRRGPVRRDQYPQTISQRSALNRNLQIWQKCLPKY